MKKRFRIYFTTGEDCSCFYVTETQIKGIAKQYHNVEKVVEVVTDPLTQTNIYRVVEL